MAHDRFRARIPTEFRAGRVKGKGKVRNLSEGGLFVGTSALPAEGDTVQLELAPPGGPAVHVTGMVWWITQNHRRHGTPGFGVQLFEPGEEYDRMVRALT